MSLLNTRRGTKVAESDSTRDLSNAVNKRQAEDVLERETDKRSAFVDLTNAGVKKNNAFVKKEKKTLRKTNKCDVNNDRKTVLKSESIDVSIKSSQESKCSSSDSTAFLSALDTSPQEESVPHRKSLATLVVPSDVDDFDKTTVNDPYAEANYALDIFEYYKQREKQFKLDKYLERQPELSKGMRAILTDWLVEVQESFELNHETLYLAVKLVDHYLMKTKVSKSQLQLLGATAVFIACKFDERSPPLIDDFLYICDDAYTRHEMIIMELSIIKTLNFDLGIPLSYRFLRRYARCAKVSMEILTLARFILESSLMDYDLISELDSKMAAAALFLALAMKKTGKWNSTLVFYSGYSEADLSSLVLTLNNLISQPTVRTLKTVRVKYAHKVFFEVAKIPPLPMAVDN